MTAYLLKQRLAGRKRFPLVLMLEPSHACNLKCTGCGRIREYADTLDRRLSIEECLDAVDECGAPVVSVCGGWVVPSATGIAIDRSQFVLSDENSRNNVPEAEAGSMCGKTVINE